MNDIDNVVINEKYSKEEIAALASFIETIKNDETRSELACWGNYAKYNKGY